ncbi:type IX secretion system PorP/SprF family membrane protein [Spirosoma oryzae]|uniref:Type IX secretion system PorP/SprF family membrane protein n=1 Tax=Spirosoma oryzae TaxID=1469603 RepID=A0A2T0TBN5_9BACT|nr:PorP/SprF family type IX secretion system membrane protein [Spirosoma oryzae]PRY43061.1 type IX secretion system PorP/SprF family membrane protein [Spirosoma oryzae]
MRNRWLVVVGIVCGLAGSVQAQREMLYSQYLVNNLSINPAYAGSRESFHLSAFLRRKWFNARNVPVSQAVSMDGAVNNGRVGLGFQAFNDRMGLFAATGVLGSVAYRFNLPALSHLSIGLSGGVNVLPIYDQTSAANINRAVGSLGVGVYYRADRFFAGVSAPELVSREPSIAGLTLYPAVRPLMVQAGYQFPISETAVLIPSVLISKIADRPLGVDLNARLWFAEQLGLGVSYRQNSPGLIQTNYVQLLAEYQISSAVRLGYQFYSRTPESPNAMQYNESSVHEIMLRFSPNALRFSY